MPNRFNKGQKNGGSRSRRAKKTYNPLPQREKVPERGDEGVFARHSRKNCTNSSGCSGRLK